MLKGLNIFTHIFLRGSRDHVRGRDVLYQEEASQAQGGAPSGQDDLEDAGAASRPRVPGVQVNIDLSLTSN